MPDFHIRRAGAVQPRDIGNRYPMVIGCPLSWRLRHGRRPFGADPTRPGSERVGPPMDEKERFAVLVGRHFFCPRKTRNTRKRKRGGHWSERTRWLVFRVFGVFRGQIFLPACPYKAQTNLGIKYSMRCVPLRLLSENGRLVRRPFTVCRRKGGRGIQRGGVGDADRVMIGVY